LIGNEGAFKFNMLLVIYLHSSKTSTSVCGN